MDRARGHLTKRIILSRKGFDSSFGGGASPILTDGRMLSLPIPYAGEKTRYSDLRVDGRSLLDVMRELGYTGVDKRSRCHLDPDINRTLCERPPEWRGLFGQIDSALGHLENQGVGVGDLFVFWGLYRHTTQAAHGLQFTGRPFHAIFGYLEVGRIFNCAAGERIAWAPRFPHFDTGVTGGRGRVYEAADQFQTTALMGSGVLTFSDTLRLSDDPPSSPSVWRLPAAFHPDAGGTLTYHGKATRWDRPVGGTTRLRAVSRGQEFVTEATPRIARWARKLITTNA